MFICTNCTKTLSVLSVSVCRYRSVLANCGSFGGLIFFVSSALVSVVSYSKVWGGWGFLRTNKGEIYSPIPYVRAWREYRTIALKEDKDRTKGKGRHFCLRGRMYSIPCRAVLPRTILNNRMNFTRMI